MQGIETLDLVCLDDVDRVLGRADWELALFNLYNRARQCGCALLVAGNAAPRPLWRWRTCARAWRGVSSTSWRRRMMRKSRHTAVSGRPQGPGAEP